jgi:hypothetical protein
VTIDPNLLDRIALDYVGSMTSIRGRRVHRLLKREFASFDHLLTAVTSQGMPALVAVSRSGVAAVCRTDGRGKSAIIARWTGPGDVLTTAYDLSKDSLPSLVSASKAVEDMEPLTSLSIDAPAVSPIELAAIAGVLRKLASF